MCIYKNGSGHIKTIMATPTSIPNPDQQALLPLTCVVLCSRTGTQTGSADFEANSDLHCRPLQWRCISFPAHRCPGKSTGGGLGGVGSAADDEERRGCQAPY